MWWPDVELDMTLAFADGSFLQKRVKMPVGDVRVFDPLAEFPEAAGRPFVAHFDSRSRVLWGPHYGLAIPPVASKSRAAAQSTRTAFSGCRRDLPLTRTS